MGERSAELAQTGDGHLPLEGIRVLEIGQLIAVPSAGQQLAELGAEVIKLEPPGGEPARLIDAAYGQAMLRGYNRGKRSVELDLKTDEGRRLADELIAGTDVVLHNLRPGTLDRLGYSYDDMCELRPELISVSVSGFGAAGRSATRPGLDIAAQAESGLMSVTGEADGPPQRVGAPIIDHSTSYLVTQAVLAALMRRERFGGGTQVRVPLLDVAIHLQTPNWVEQQLTGQLMTRRGNGQPTVAPAADVLRTAKGELVVSGYQGEAWSRLCRVLDRPDLEGDERFRDNAGRVANRPALIEELESAISDRTAQETVDQLISEGVVAAVVRDYSEVLTSSEALENEIFANARTAEGDTYVVPVLPYRAQPPMTDRLSAVPALGEYHDTDKHGTDKHGADKHGADKHGADRKVEQ